MPDGPVSPRNTRHHSAVVAQIGQRIVGGEYAIGQILPREEEFVDELDVGRGVVREAIRVLASKGLVEARPKRGTQVLPTSRWQQLDPDILSWRISGDSGGHFLRDLMELRAMIEPAASAHAAARASDTDLSLISALARELKQSEGHEEHLIETDMRFHKALLKASHNDLLMQASAAIEASLRLSRDVTVSMGHFARVTEHTDVAAAIASRSPSRARRAMSQLIEMSSEDITSVLGPTWLQDGI